MLIADKEEEGAGGPNVYNAEQPRWLKILTSLNPPGRWRLSANWRAPGSTKLPLSPCYSEGGGGNFTQKLFKIKTKATLWAVSV